MKKTPIYQAHINHLVKKKIQPQPNPLKCVFKSKATYRKAEKELQKNN